MYCNNLLNYQESTPILNGPTKKSLETYWMPLVPRKYRLKSMIELIQILQTLKPNDQIITSLYVEIFFINSFVKEIMDTIIHNIYNNPTYPPSNVPIIFFGRSSKVVQLKSPSTTNTATYTYITIALQLGSAVGPTFSNFYMAHLENKMCNHIKTY